MSDERKTHYRKAFDSPYLSSADIVDPVVLTIKRVVLEKDRTNKTQDVFNTAHFEEREIRRGEPLKPMILNATNSKFLASLTGSKWIDDWAGHQVEVFVDANVRFGKETVEGLRLAKPANRPVQLAPDVIEAAEKAADKGVAAYAAWWKAVGQEVRVAMGGRRHESLKTRATEADKRSASAQQGGAQ